MVLQSDRRGSAGLYALLDSNVHLRQASAHVDGEEELDGEVLSRVSRCSVLAPTDRRAAPTRRYDFGLALLMAFFFGSSHGVEVDLPQIISQTLRAAVTAFGCISWHFPCEHLAFPRGRPSLPFFDAGNRFSCRNNNPCDSSREPHVGTLSASRKHLAESASHSTSQVSMICRSTCGSSRAASPLRLKAEACVVVTASVSWTIWIALSPSLTAGLSS
jgi:hypothetical protein